MKNVDIARLRRTLMLYATVGAFVMGLVASIAAILPFADRLNDAAAEGLRGTARSTAQSINSLIAGRHKVIRQISGGAEARRLMQALLTGQMPADAWRTETAAILAQARGVAAEDVLGVTRVTRDGSARVSVGESVEQPLWPADWATAGQVHAVGPQMTAAGLRVVAVAPVLAPDGTRMGSDIYVLDVGPVAQRLGLSKQRSGGSTRVYLLDPVDTHLLMANGGRQAIDSRPELPAARILAALAVTDDVALLSTGSLLVAVAPVGVNGWGLVVAREADEVFAGLRSEMGVVAGIVVLLAAMGAGGLYLMLRPLAGTLVIHADTLEHEVAQATSAERQARSEAEDALQALQQAQENLIQSRNMASLGSLVAGVAHEINTPVGIVLTSASYLEQETGKLKQAYEAEALTVEDLSEYMAAAQDATRLIVSNATRAADLIHSFKQVAVDQTAGERRSIDLAEYVNEVLTSLRPKFKRRPVTVAVEVPDGLTLDTFPGALSQVLTNLVVNSLTHGFVTEDTPGTITIKVTDQGDEVELVYGDDGHGIDAEHRARVFDPFFTTRRNAGGSGLGLHILFNLVTRTLNGSVRLDDAAERGTRFILRLPKRL